MPGARSLARAYTDAGMGYVPTEDAYSAGGYETGAHVYFPGAEAWDPGLEEVIRNETRSAMQDVMAD